MNALALSAVIFVLTLSGIFLGTLLRRTLPEHHLNEHARDVARLGVGVIATIAALVLGLLIAAAKGSFDTQTTLFLFALSAACAIFLILQLSRPFTGLMSISSAPLRNALGTI
jgi:quinol-cytochrome oxidoreductase complex cytochrome b subunit